MCSIMGEALFGFLAAASLSMLIKVIRGGGPWFALGCGAMLTVAALTKPAIVPFVPFAAGFAMFTGGGQRVMNGAAVLAGFALFLAPWVIRNRVVTGRLIPLSTAGPLNLYLGNSPEYYVAGDINIRHWTDCRQFQGASRAEQEKALASLAFTRMAADPIGAIALFARKTSIMWLGGLGRPPRISGPLSSVRVAGLAMESQAVLFIPAFVLALYGWMTLGRRTRKRALPVVMLMACVTLSYALTFSTMRYSTPLNPYLLAFAMAGLLHRRPVESET
jgi:4-amino-4-deoxy-L-arabinose transferase-like glycosyltransferase